MTFSKVNLFDGKFNAKNKGKQKRTLKKIYSRRFSIFSFAIQAFVSKTHTSTCMRSFVNFLLT